MVDIQNSPDTRNIDIQKVGVKGIKYPVTVLDKKKGTQDVNATISMFVNLPHHFKGTHMSRFVEIINEYRGRINIKTFHEILTAMRQKLEAQSAHMEIDFPYFVEKKAPVSGAKSIMEYRCSFTGENTETTRTFFVGVTVPVTTLCPCSKEISAFGAHNQRSIVTITLQFKKFFWIEDVIQLVEESASSEIFPLLKRRDEKYVTEHAYENPMFVEDVVRTVAEKLKKIDNFTWYSIEAENFESIHNHSAYAYLEKSL